MSSYRYLYLGRVHMRGDTNKDLNNQNVESENGQTVLATTGKVPSKVVARKADDKDCRNKAVKAGK